MTSEQVSPDMVEEMSVATEEMAVTDAPTSSTNPLTFEAIRPKMKLAGTVKRVELQGAIIDIGLEHDGLLHISQLSAESVKNVTDVVNEGDSVAAYVLAVDAKTGRLDLTLIAMPELGWNEIRVNMDVDGVVERIEKYGVFVDIGAERPGLVHVSQLAKGYVNNPEDVVKVGDAVRARVIGVNKRKKQIDLSISALEADAVEAAAQDSDEEEVVFATAMEIALRKAMGTEDGGKGGKKRKKKGQSNTQADIIARTLRMHGN